MNIAIVILVIIILVLICGNLYRNENNLHRYLEGLWVADEDFCKESSVDGILLYIGPPEKLKHKAYIIMYADGNIILEKKITMKTSIKPKFSEKYDTYVYLEDVDDDVPLDKFMNKCMKLKLDIIKGCMEWSDDKKIYARLYKDNMA